MTARRPLFVRLWRKLFPEKPAPAAPIRLAPLEGKAAGKPPARPVRSSIEPLEGRIAPAVLVGGKVLKYTDSDGDLVTITFSKAIFSENLSVATLDQIFQFSTGADPFNNAATPQQLQLIDLTQIPVSNTVSPAAGVSFTETVVKVGAGDGVANIGAINATGISLGSVVIDGDLGHIDAGDGHSAMGVKSLTVGSLGVQPATQSGTPNFTSTIIGQLGSFNAGTVQGAFLDVTNGLEGVAGKSIGSIGSIDITHTLTASVLAAGTGTAPTDDGVIETDGSIGSIKIGSGVLTGATPDGLIGGWGSGSGGIVSGGTIGSLTIDGVVTGGLGSSSASVTAVGTIGSITIDGNILGGDGTSSASVFASGAVGPVKVLGSITGGNGTQSGSIRAGGNLGTVSIGTTQNPGLIGGAGDNSGEITSDGNISSITVFGNVQGGNPETSNGTDVTGSSASSSGAITAVGTIGAVTIDGSLIGGGGASSGLISSTGKMGTVKILGGVTGGDGSESATIHAASNIGTVSIGAAATHLGLIGGMGDGSGAVTSGASISKITVFGNLAGADPEMSNGAVVTGSSASASGAITATDALGTVTIEGNIVGAGGASGGEITAGTTIGTVKILGSVTGGDGELSGAIDATGNLGSVSIGTAQNPGLIGGDGNGSGVVSGANISSVTILGNIQGGNPETSSGSPVTGSSATDSGGISATGKLGAVTVSGSLLGEGGQGSGFIEGVLSAGSVKIGLAVMGGSGDNSGSIVSGGNFSSVTVGTVLSGGAGNDSGSIFGASAGAGTLGSVVIGSTVGSGELFGGLGNNSGSVISSGAIGSVTVNGPKVGGAALAGGAGTYSGTIFAEETIRAVKITGEIVGGAGDHSAAIEAHVLLGSVTVSGEMTGGAGNASASISSVDSVDGTQPGNITKITGQSLIGGAGTNSGQISADGSIGSVNLTLLQAGSVTGSGAIVTGQGILGVGAAGSLTIAKLEGTVDVNGHLGSLTVGSEVSDATVHVADDLGSLSVVGDVTDSTFTARGQAVQGAKTDLAIGKIAITGAVSGTEFLAGYDVNGNAVNGNAQIGAVTVGGNWTASDLIAGTQAGPDGLFGTADDTAIAGGSPNIVSRIASVVIGGQVFGTAATGDHFGFVAEVIGSFKVDKTAVVLQNGVAELDTATTADVTVREVPVV